MLSRLGITLVNIFFPPMAVFLLCGPDLDLAINCALFILAIIPSHIHGFYISLTYFNRKRKVRKGRYPGDRKSGIYSEKVQNGGASRKEVKQLLWEQEHGKEKGGLLSRSSTKRSRRSQASYQPVSGVGEYGAVRPSSRQSSLSGHRASIRSNIGRRYSDVDPTSAHPASDTGVAYPSQSVQPGVVDVPNRSRVPSRPVSIRSSGSWNSHVTEGHDTARRTAGRQKMHYPPNSFPAQPQNLARSSSRGSSFLER